MYWAACLLCQISNRVERQLCCYVLMANVERLGENSHHENLLAAAMLRPDGVMVDNSLQPLVE